MSGFFSYKGYTFLPRLKRADEGGPFAGTWMIGECAFGRRHPFGFEVRFLVGENTHFETRGAALGAALEGAVHTIDRNAVGEVHLVATAGRWGARGR